MSEQQRWRVVVALTAAGLAVLTSGALVLAGAALVLLEQFMSDELLFFLGLVLGVVLLPAAILPVLAVLALWRMFVRMVRQGPGDRAGPRLVGIEVAAGVSLTLAGGTLYGEPGGTAILVAGLVVFACGVAALRVASSGPKTADVMPLPTPAPPSPPSPPRDTSAEPPATAEWTWHIDLTRRRPPAR